jgi:hypothetical protein
LPILTSDSGLGILSHRNRSHLLGKSIPIYLEHKIPINTYILQNT